MDGARIVIVDREIRIVAAEPELPPPLRPLRQSRRLPPDLELLVRHAIRSWRGSVASCRESFFVYNADLGVRVFAIVDGDSIRVGISLQRLIWPERSVSTQAP